MLRRRVGFRSGQRDSPCFWRGVFGATLGHAISSASRTLAEVTGSSIFVGTLRPPITVVAMGMGMFEVSALTNTERWLSLRLHVQYQEMQVEAT